MVEGPFVSTPAPEDLSEQILGRIALEKDILPRGVLVAESRRNRHPFHAQISGKIQIFGHFLRRFPLKDGAINCHAETLGEGKPDDVDRAVEDTVLTHGGVMPLTVTVQVNGEGQVRGWLVIVDALIEQERIAAQVDVLAACNQAAHDLRHLLVQQRLPACDGHHRRAALVGGLQTVLDAEPLPQDVARIIDLSAPGAGQVALKQGLEHEHQGVAFHPTQLLSDHVTGNLILLAKGYAHLQPPPWCWMRPRTAAYLRREAWLAMRQVTLLGRVGISRSRPALPALGARVPTFRTRREVLGSVLCRTLGRFPMMESRQSRPGSGSAANGVEESGATAGTAGAWACQ